MRLAQSRALWVCVLVISWWLTLASADDTRQPRMGVFTKPSAQVDLSLEFTDSDGGHGMLSSFIIPDRPFILVPVFYRCPRLCGLTVSGVVELINRVGLKIGKDYSVVFYSFNPDDTSKDAAEKRSKTVARLSEPPSSRAAMRFLTADAKTIARINDELGFRVRYADKELEHSSAIFVVTSQGKVTRYFAGVEFKADAVKMAVLSAHGQ